MKTACPKCQANDKTKEENIGQKTKCWRCGEWYTIAEGEGTLLSQQKQKDRGQTTVIRGRVQMSIGIVVGILLLFSSVGGEILSVYTEYTITHNQELLISLGHDPANFQQSPFYWIGRLTFHTFGLVAILVYVISVALKRLKVVKVGFLLCLIYFMTQAYGNITNLSQEEQVRGLTFGAWVAITILWLPRYAVELGLLIQGWLGVRKRMSNSGHWFLRSQGRKYAGEVKGDKCKICDKKISESEKAYIEDGELLCTECERKTAKSQDNQKQ
ncbi:MAG: hypothetical protein FVQ85_06225 [Planctomycetes bacterium]|nr:hypothetical protein [Planctomycetota bacterium]